MNIYKNCPSVWNERFSLRLVREEDCEDLLKVYSDTKAVPLFNSDNCHGDDFHYTTRERMMEAVWFWLWSYQNGWFIRWSIVDENTNGVIGTLELCHRVSQDSYNGCGILRLDLRSDYEKEETIWDILEMIVPPAFYWLDCSCIITKAVPLALTRRHVLQRFGFTPCKEALIGSDGTAYGDYYAFRKG